MSIESSSTIPNEEDIVNALADDFFVEAITRVSGRDDEDQLGITSILFPVNGSDYWKTQAAVNKASNRLTESGYTTSTRIIANNPDSSFEPDYCFELNITHKN